MRYRVTAAGRTHPGRVRAINEDTHHIGERVLVVADGVGGEAGGEIASQTVASIIANVATSGPTEDVYQSLTDAVARGSHAIARQVQEEPGLAGMSTTITVMLGGDRRIVFAQVGDSRAYYLRAKKPETLHQVTRDDSFVQELVDAGVINREQAQHHPQRNLILKAVGDHIVAPSFASYAPVVGDRYLLCSDGLTDYVAESDIHAVVVAEHRDVAADRLIDLALRAGAPDNVTVIVADLTTP
ncbi:MAG: protein phosphatase 2C domain-containing protein [Actinomycetota bacterium]|nr:protein phosphatase 2C domain-containing protein [Actinomycetota bacterium]